MDIQRAVEDCIDAIFSDYSVHPSGAIVARKSGCEVRIYPKRVDGVLSHWGYEFTDRRGNTVVSADDLKHTQNMVHTIQKWAWSL